MVVLWEMSRLKQVKLRVRHGFMNRFSQSHGRNLVPIAPNYECGDPTRPYAPVNRIRISKRHITQGR
jgi:hypothetical protein